MATLKETINATIDELRAEADRLEREYKESIEAIAAEIQTAETHLTAFVPWLEHEASAAKEAINAFFGKLGA